MEEWINSCSSRGRDLHCALSHGTFGNSRNVEDSEAPGNRRRQIPVCLDNNAYNY